MTDGEVQRSDQWLDEEALRQLSTGYAAAVDARDGDRFAELFVADGELVVPDFPDDLRPVITRAGHDVLRKVPQGLRRYARTFHQVSNIQLAVDGDRAAGEVQCVAHHVSAIDGDRAGEPLAGTDVVWFIRYADRYRRTASGWKFERRALHLQWVEHHPVALLAPVPAD
jgi:hypothetical protein